MTVGTLPAAETLRAESELAPELASDVVPADLDEARRLLADAEAKLRRWDAPLEVALLAVVDRRFTDEIATMAVRLRADGIATLLVNPAFVLDIGAEGCAFGLCHEAMHLLLNHLRYDGPRDDAWRWACEAVINHWVVRATSRPLPRSRSTGGVVGVDPHAVYADYAAAAADPVDFARFVATDEGCAALLRTLPAGTPPPPACGPPLPAPDDDDTGGSGHGSPGEVIDRILEQAVVRSLEGDEVLRQRLLDLEETVPGAAAWHRAGLGDLRATTSRLGTTRLWQTQLAHVIGQTLAPELQVRYDRKVGWWDQELLAPLGIHLDADVGMPLTLTAATTRHRQVAIYLDVSGSIDDEVLTAVASTVGHIPDTTVHWRSFDDDVHVFEPGEVLPGGGGTNFTAVAADVADLDDELAEPLDAVVVLTDGYAPPIHPPDAQRWIWLIVAGGDAWPRDHGMRTVVIPDL